MTFLQWLALLALIANPIAYALNIVVSRLVSKRLREFSMRLDVIEDEIEDLLGPDDPGDGEPVIEPIRSNVVALRRVA